MPKYFLFLCIFILLVCVIDAQTIQQSLNEGWTFSANNADDSRQAFVPGNIYTDLFIHNVITHPFHANNEAHVQWVAQKDWVYRLNFTPDSNILSKNNIRLCFDGLDTRADIYLNGYLLAKVNNMHTPYRFDVKNILFHGENQIEVHFHSPASLSDSLWNAYPVRLPDHERVMMRKAQYHFGWDWGPKLMTMGIWRPVFLEGYEKARIMNIQFITHEVMNDTAHVECAVTLEVSQPGEFSLEVRFDELSFLKNISLSQGEKGQYTHSTRFAIPSPRLWWPNGAGDQNLYQLECRIYTPENSLIDTKTTTCGIRTIELVRETDDTGESFFFRINGKPIFIKGANYIPADFFAEQTSPSRYEELIRLAAESNMNMLRVWGGGIYEDDSFYELCNRYGILVWQDFMFACAMYPFHHEFLESVKEEATANVIRLRNHPCIALWCGNNENDEGWHNWGWQKQFGINSEDSALIYDGYLQLFENLLPQIVEEYAGPVPYWPSSPSTGWGRPEAYISGDVHYWGVWWGFRPFETYITHTGRFVSEYGFQGFPQPATLLEANIDMNQGLEHPTMKQHQKHPRGFETISAYMKMYAHVPENIEDYAYLSQYIQLLGISTAIEAHRRAMPHCMGTLYWQFNDCWPVISWSGVDYYGRKKALQFHMKELYNPVKISMIEHEGHLQVWGISDNEMDESYSLIVHQKNFKGKGKSRKFEVKLAAGSSALLTEIPVPSKQKKRSKLFFHALLLKNGEVIAGNTFYPVFLKEQKLPDPKISINAAQHNDQILLELRSPVLCRFVELSYFGEVDVFDANYFDLLPGKTTTIHVNTEMIEDFDFRNIRIRTLNDLFR